MLKRALIIGLCWIFAVESVFPDNDLADLSHLPELLDHFAEHKIQSPRLSFAEFLMMHYDNTQHLTATPGDHQDLPFSKRHHHRVSLQVAPEIVTISVRWIGALIMNIELPDEHVHFSGCTTLKFWQPPRT